MSYHWYLNNKEFPAEWLDVFKTKDEDIIRSSASFAHYMMAKEYIPPLSKNKKKNDNKIR